MGFFSAIKRLWKGDTAPEDVSKPVEAEGSAIVGTSSTGSPVGTGAAMPAAQDAPSPAAPPRHSHA